MDTKCSWNFSEASKVTSPWSVKKNSRGKYLRGKISVIKCPLKYWWWYIRKPDIFKVASGYLGSYFDIVVYPSACLLFHREKTILSCGWMQTSCEIKCLPQYSLQLSFPSLSPFKLLPLFASVQRCTECSASAEGQGLWHSQLSQSWKSPQHV